MFEQIGFAGEKNVKDYLEVLRNIYQVYIFNAVKMGIQYRNKELGCAPVGNWGSIFL